MTVPGPLSFDAERPWAQLGFIVAAPQFAPFFVIGMMVYRLRAGTLGGLGRLALAAALGLTLLGRAISPASLAQSTRVSPVPSRQRCGSRQVPPRQAA